MKKIFITIAVAGVALACIAATRRQISVEGNTMILAGTSITTSDGTTTNTFSTPFSSVPVVVVSEIGLDTTTTNVITVTTSNFVHRIGRAATNKWIAVGTP